MMAVNRLNLCHGLYKHCTGDNGLSSNRPIVYYDNIMILLNNYNCFSATGDGTRIASENNPFSCDNFLLPLLKQFKQLMLSLKKL